MYAKLDVHMGDVGFGRAVGDVERPSNISARVAFGEHA